MAEKKLNFTIKDGDLFYADEVAVIHNPAKLFIDFKNTSPRIDVRFNQQQPMVLAHNVIVMDLWTAKQLRDVLVENITNYENRFGEIKKPEPIEQSERMAAKAQKEKKVKPQHPPSYMG